MLLSKPFILLYVMNIFSCMSGYFIVGQTVNYALSNGYTDPAFLSLIASLGAIFNAARFIWSWWLDYSTYRRVYGTLLVTQIFIDFTLPIISHNRVLYTIWICIGMSCEGGHFSLAPNVVKKIFGSKATQLYGFFLSFASVANIFIFLMQKYLLVDTR
jgi:hypothetical protein